MISSISLNKSRPATTANEVWGLTEQLFSVYRSLMGSGYQESLDLIDQIIQIETVRIPSGTQCGSWTVPQEWQVSHARLETSGGEILADFRSDPMSLWHYSSSFRGIVPRHDLENHVKTAPECPHARPHVVGYYSDSWGFSLPHQSWSEVDTQKFKVEIDAEFVPGDLLIGQVLLPGERPEEIVLDAVLNCPALANNLTGPVILAFLARYLKALNTRRYTYRILFTPETIGPIALYHATGCLGGPVIGGYTLSNLGDGAGFHYRRSRDGSTVTDRAMEHALRHTDATHEVSEFDVRTGTAGNEKAYNSLGMEIPIGAIRRSPLGSYPEYDTDADDLSRIGIEYVMQSLELMQSALTAIDACDVYENCFVGEPFLTGYDLLPKIEDETSRLPYDYLISFADGKHSLLEIADRAGLHVSAFEGALRDLERAGLIKRIGRADST